MKQSITHVNCVSSTVNSASDSIDISRLVSSQFIPVKVVIQLHIGPNIDKISIGKYGKSIKLINVCNTYVFHNVERRKYHIYPVHRRYVTIYVLCVKLKVPTYTEIIREQKNVTYLPIISPVHPLITSFNDKNKDLDVKKIIESITYSSDLQKNLYSQLPVGIYGELNFNYIKRIDVRPNVEYKIKLHTIVGMIIIPRTLRLGYYSKQLGLDITVSLSYRDTISYYRALPSQILQAMFGIPDTYPRLSGFISIKDINGIYSISGKVLPLPVTKHREYGLKLYSKYPNATIYILQWKNTTS